MSITSTPPPVETVKRPLWKRLMQPEVRRDPTGLVIGPASQFIAAGVTQNKKPFSASTVGKVMAFFFALGLAAKSGVLRSPADMVSIVDSLTDGAAHLLKTTAQGHPELKADYFEGFTKSLYKCNSKDPADIPGETCYAPGGTYYDHATKEPGYARLWGHGLLGDGADPATKNILLGLIVLGGAGAFIYGNRKQLRAFMQDLAMRHTGTDKKTVMDVVRDSGALAQSGAKAVALTAFAMAALGGADRSVAQPMAMVMMGVGGWYVLSHEYRALVRKIPGATEMSIPKALACGAVWIGGEAVYRLCADSAGTSQFLPGGHQTIYGGWLGWDLRFNTDTFAADIGEHMLGAPFAARAGAVVMNAVDVCFSRVSRRSIAVDNDEHGVAYPKYLSVKSGVNKLMPPELQRVRAGDLPVSRAAAVVGEAVVLAGLITLGYFGGKALGALATGESYTTVADGVLTAAGGLSAILGASRLLGPTLGGKANLAYRRLASVMGHMLVPNERWKFWLLMTVIGPIGNVTVGVCSQAMKGFEGADYFVNLAVRSSVNPWVNRISMGLQDALRDKLVLSSFSFFAPGYFTLYSGIEYSKQIEQTANLLYGKWARDYTLTQEAEVRADNLALMHGLESAVREAIVRPDTPADVRRTAVTTLTAIEKMNRQYGIPPHIVLLAAVGE